MFSGLEYVMVVAVAFGAYVGPQRTYVTSVESHIVPGVYKNYEVCKEVADELKNSNSSVFGVSCIPKGKK